jgi:hypothetical protein
MFKGLTIVRGKENSITREFCSAYDGRTCEHNNVSIYNDVSIYDVSRYKDAIYNDVSIYL